MTLQARIIGTLIAAAILILGLAGLAMWLGIQNDDLTNQLNEISRIDNVQYVDRPVIIEKEIIKYETSIVTETVEVIPDDFDYFLEYYFQLQKMEQDHYEKCEGEYPIATLIWTYLTSTCGYNPYVAAGIMGNLMNETAGNTLNIRPLTYGGSEQGYYGICQWAQKYHPDVYGTDLGTQLVYLSSTIPAMFDNYGYLYKKGFTYADFCNLQDAQSAAIAFMRVYERPSSLTYTTRQVNALKAYQYFVVDYSMIGEE